MYALNRCPRFAAAGLSRPSRQPPIPRPRVNGTMPARLFAPIWIAPVPISASRWPAATANYVIPGLSATVAPPAVGIRNPHRGTVRAIFDLAASHTAEGSFSLQRTRREEDPRLSAVDGARVPSFASPRVPIV
jgi:hypothetical protein